MQHWLFRYILPFFLLLCPSLKTRRKSGKFDLSKSSSEWFCEGHGSVVSKLSRLKLSKDAL